MHVICIEVKTYARLNNFVEGSGVKRSEDNLTKFCNHIIRILQLVHQNFILTKQRPLQDPFSSPILSGMPLSLRMAEMKVNCNILHKSVILEIQHNTMQS